MAGMLLVEYGAHVAETTHFRGDWCSVSDQASGGNPSDLVCRLCGDEIFSPVGDMVVEATSARQVVDDEQPLPRSRWEYHYGDIRTFRIYWALYGVGLFVMIIVPETLLFIGISVMIDGCLGHGVTCNEHAGQAFLLGFAVIGLGFVAVMVAAYRFRRLTLLLLAIPLLVPAIFVTQAWLDTYHS